MRGQARRYLSALLWVARDGLPRFRGRVALIVLCNFLAIASAASALGGVMLYARHAEHGQPLRVLGWTVHLSDLRTLALFGSGIAALGVMSALCQYLTDRLVLMTAREHHAFCAQRAAAIVEDPLCRGWQSLDDDAPRQIAARMMSSASRHTALALRDMLRLMLPALTFITAVAFLFVIDVTLTLLLIPAAALYLLPLYLINRQVTRRQREFRALGSQARGEIGRSLRGLVDDGPGGSADVERPRSALERPAHRGMLAALYGRLLADRRTHMLNTAFFVACLVALLLFFGVQAREHGRSWADLLFYLVALRFVITSLRQMTSISAKFSRFFPEYSAYGAFIRRATQTRARRGEARTNPQPLPEMLAIRIGRRGRWDSARAVKLRRRAPLWVIVPQPPGYADLEAVAVRLEERVSPPIDLATNAAFLVREGGADDATDVSLVVAAHDACSASEARSRGRDGERFLVIVTHRPEVALRRTQEHGPAGAVIVLDGRAILGGGDAAWLAANVTAIERELEQRAQQKTGRRPEESGSDDDDDEDGA